MPIPIYTPHCPTGSYPTWIPVAAALPDSPRCVLCTDLEGTFIGCHYQELDEDGPQWIDTQTEDPFDSVITHWMELPPVPEDDN